jgi:phospholipid/cholesterol/gamma-HCH transport system substrate-binding protein
LVNVRQVTEKFNATFDEKTQANLRAVASNAAAGTARFDRVMTDLEPLARDLGALPGKSPATNFGQTLMRLNRIAFEIGMLTRTLVDKDGKLSSNGSLAKLFANSELYDNINGMAAGAREVFASVRPLVKNLNRFAERLANDPGIIGRSALQRQ